MPDCPRVAVIVLSYNGKRFFADCCASLAALDYPAADWTLVIVDNGSRDGSVAEARARAPHAELIALPKNLGFAGGNNVGMRWALGREYDYVALLNNDTRVDPQWLRALVDAAESGPDVAVCGSKILSWDGKLIEYSGSVFWKETTSGGYTDEPDDGRYNRVAPAGYACGGACLFRAAALRAVGLFDDDYFCYHEDVDLSVRAWLAGWRVLYVPDSRMYHYRGGSTAGTAWRDYIGPRNALTTWLKCYEPRTWRRYARHQWNWYSSAPHLRRWLLYNLAVLPRTLVKRRAVQRQRRISDEEFFRRLAAA